MGTHPIFESDFDCLTDMSETAVAAVEEKKPKTWGYIKDCCDLVCCDWAEIAPAGNGKAQSPIDIVDAKPCGELQPISINYDNATVESIFNNGHSVQVKISPGSTISGAHLNGEYELIQFHFHWGSKRGQGAEHLIRGESSDAELHFVHAKKCPDIPDYNPLEHSDGLAVLGVRLVEMDWRENTSFKTLTDHFENLSEIGKEYPCIGIDLERMLPDLSNFYTYQGSLTTPPLNECVCWMVCEKPKPISSSEMAAFRSLKDASGHTLNDNYRPVQALNQRLLRTNILKGNKF